MIGIGLLAAAAIGVAALMVALLTGSAAAVEAGNANVTVENSTGEIYVEATFTSTVDDANATADVTVLDPNGSEFATDVLNGTSANTSSTSVGINDTDPNGTYQVLVETGTADVVESTSVTTFPDSSDDGGGGSVGFLEDETNMAVAGISAVLLILGTAALARRVARGS